MKRWFDIGHRAIYTQPAMRTLCVILMGGFIATGTAFAAPQEGQSNTDSIRSAIEADSAKLSTEEKKKRAEIMLTEMRESLKRASEVLGEARTKKDIVQLNCVNRRLGQIKGLLKISEAASVKMYQAFADDKAEDANLEFTKIAVAHQKTLVLRAETDGCASETTVYSGETRVDVQVREGLISNTGDPTNTGGPATAAGETANGFFPSIPPVASGS